MAGSIQYVHALRRSRHPYKLVALHQTNLEAIVPPRSEECGVKASNEKRNGKETWPKGLLSERVIHEMKL